MQLSLRCPLVVLAVLTLGFGCSKASAPATSAQVETANPVVDAANALSAVSEPAAAAVDPATVVATVNDAAITQGDVDKEVNMLMSRAQGRVPPEQLAQLKSRFQTQVLDHLVNMKMLTQEASKNNLSATDAEIDAEIARMEAQAQGRANINDMLKQLNATTDDLRRDISLQLTINKLIDQNTTSVAPPTDEEIKSFYDKNPDQFNEPENVKAHHILIAFEPTDTPEQKAAKKAKAEDLQKRLASGEDFNELAMANSDDPGSKGRGGDLGAFSRGQMVPQFEAAAFSQPAGEIGPLVETEFGYHIIRVDSHNVARTVPLEEVKEQLSKYLLAQNRQKASQEYVTNLRSGAAITFPTGAGPAPEPSAAP